MSLLEHQVFLGRCLRACGASAPAPGIVGAAQGTALDAAEAAELIALVGSSEFRFTQRVRRSWCEGRTAVSAELTLSVLPSELRRRLVENWVDAGGGVAFDPMREADGFLEFVASHLSDPSHELTICRMEQATYRASEAALRFTPRDPSLLDHPKTLLRAGRSAALVRFLAAPEQLFQAIQAKDPLPPVCDHCFPVLFAPGLPTLCRAACHDEVAVWEKLARPIKVQLLCRDRNARQAVEKLYVIGAADRVAEGA